MTESANQSVATAFRLILGGLQPCVGLWGGDETSTDLASAQEAMRRRIRSLLPQPPGSILLLAPDPAPLAGLLAEEGYEVTARLVTRPEIHGKQAAEPDLDGLLLQPASRRDPAQSPFTAVVLQDALEHLPPLRIWLARLRDLLVEEGRLVIADTLAYGSDTATASGLARSTELAIVLAELGFCLHKQQQLSESVERGFALIMDHLREPVASSLARRSGACQVENLEQARQRWQHRCGWLAEGRIGYELVSAGRDEFFVRPYRDGDEAQIRDLFRSCFHRQRGLEHWRWKYRDNPYGRLMISLAFAADGSLAAHYSGYPVRLRDHTAGSVHEFLAVHIGDTMTAKWARRVGRGRTSLLARATQHFFARFCEEQVGYNYGFNTGKIQRYYMHFAPGSRRFESVRFRVRDLERSPLAPPSFLAALRGYHVTRTRALDGAWDRFFASVAASYGFLIERDARYLRWRYQQCPDAEYFIYAVERWGRLVGWGVFRQRDDRLIWGDALFDRRHGSAAAALLRAVLARPEHAASRRIETWFAAHPAWWSRILDGLGFALEPEPDDLGMIYLPFLEPDPVERFRDHYYYTMGDGDLF